MKKLLCCAVLALLMMLVYSPCPVRAESKELLGAGATFPYPLYSKMFDTYYQAHKVKINYQAIGSGGGIQQLISKTVDFGGTDAFLNEREMKKAEVPILHIPTCLGAVVVTYNLPEKPQLRFTPDVIADIFLGKITRWDDPRIAAINPDGQASRHEYRRCAPLRRQRHHVHLQRLPEQGEQGLGI